MIKSIISASIFFVSVFADAQMVPMPTQFDRWRPSLGDGIDLNLFHGTVKPGSFHNDSPSLGRCMVGSEVKTNVPLSTKYELSVSSLVNGHGHKELIAALRLAITQKRSTLAGAKIDSGFENRSKTEFAEFCGDHYVSALEYGGSAYIVKRYSISTDLTGSEMTSLSELNVAFVGEGATSSLFADLQSKASALDELLVTLRPKIGFITDSKNGFTATSTELGKAMWNAPAGTSAVDWLKLYSDNFVRLNEQGNAVTGIEHLPYQQ